MPLDEIIRGKLALFIHRKNDGWAVFDIDHVDGQIVRATGVLPDNIEEGDTIELAGKYVSTAYGDQFKASHLISHLSGQPDTIVMWLSTNLPNVGPERAKLLVKQFGGGLWHTIDTNPQALAVVPGITSQRVQEIVAAYAGVRSARENVLRLTGAGMSIKDAARILAELGPDAFNILESDPYQTLLRRRIEFEVVDKVAQQLFKLSPQDKRRVRAFAQRILFEKTYFEGHCYVMWFELMRATGEALKLKDPIVEAALVDYDEIVMHGKRCMLLDIDEAESVIAARVRELLARAS